MHKAKGETDIGCGDWVKAKNAACFVGSGSLPGGWCELGRAWR